MGFDRHAAATAMVGDNVCAVVVSHDRRELLSECLSRLGAQTVPPGHVLVVDTASSDESPAMVRERFPWVELLALTENLGGAGGFNRGLARAHAQGHEWIWLLDDDTLPTADALAELLAAAQRAPGRQSPALLASRVLWTDGRPHPMNRSGPRWRRLDEMLGACAVGLTAVRYATFVSALVNRRAVDEHGLPIARYFLWSDDLEYTGRILRRDAGYVVPTSIVHHATQRPYTALEASGDRYYFHVRNTLLMLRGRSWDPLERLRYLRLLVQTTRAYVAGNGWSATALAVVARGVRDGLLEAPS